MALINKHNKVFISFLWLIVTLVLSQSITVANEHTHRIFVIVNLVSYFLCYYNWLTAGCRLASAYIFFVTYCMMSNLGQSILYAAMVPDELLSVYTLVNFDGIVKLLRFEATCIAGLSLGTALYVKKPERCVSIQELKDAKPTGGGNDNLLSILLYVCLGYFVFFMAEMIVLRQSLTYAEMFDEARRNQGLIYGFINLGYLMLSMYFLFQDKHTKLIMFSNLFVALGYLYIGSKGKALPSLCILLLTVPVIRPNWFLGRKKVVWIIGSILAFATLSLFTSMRSQSVGSITVETNLATNFLGTMSEMGYSMRAASLTIESVDGGTPMYQTILFTFIRALIPFSSNISIIDQADFNLSNWITDYAGSFNSGIGFSCVGELYMNYGWFAFLFTVLWGFFISYAENHAYKLISQNKFLFALILLAIVCTLILWARDEFIRVQGVLRSSLYLLIISLFITKR